MKSKVKRRDADPQPEGSCHDEDAGTSAEASGTTSARSVRRSTRKRSAPAQFVTESKKTFAYWSVREKEKLLEILNELNSKEIAASGPHRYPVKLIRKKVGSKTVEEVKKYLAVLERRSAGVALSKMKLQPPLESWLQMSDQMTLLARDESHRQIMRVCSLMALESTRKDGKESSPVNSSNDGDDMETGPVVASKASTVAPKSTSTASTSKAPTARAAPTSKAAPTARAAPTSEAASTSLSPAPGKPATAASTATTTAAAAAALLSATAAPLSVAPPASMTSASQIGAPTSIAPTCTPGAPTTEAPTSTAAPASAESAPASTAALTSATPTATAPLPLAPEKATAPSSSAPEKATAPSSSAPEKAAAPSPSAPEKATTPSSLAPDKAAAPSSSAPEKAAAPSSSAPEKAAALSSSAPVEAAAPSSKESERTESRESGAREEVPDYTSIYKYIGDLMKGEVRELGPLESLVVLDCLKLVESHLKGRDNREQREFVQERLLDLLKNFHLSIEVQDSQIPAAAVKGEFAQPVTIGELLAVLGRPEPRPDRADRSGAAPRSDDSPTGAAPVSQADVAAETASRPEGRPSATGQSDAGAAPTSQWESAPPSAPEPKASSSDQTAPSAANARASQNSVGLGSLNPFSIPLSLLDIRKVGESGTVCETA